MIQNHTRVTKPMFFKLYWYTIRFPMLIYAVILVAFGYFAARHLMYFDFSGMGTGAVVRETIGESALPFVLLVLGVVALLFVPHYLYKNRKKEFTYIFGDSSFSVGGSHLYPLPARPVRVMAIAGQPGGDGEDDADEAAEEEPESWQEDPWAGGLGSWFDYSSIRRVLDRKGIFYLYTEGEVYLVDHKGFTDGSPGELRALFAGAGVALDSNLL